MCPPRTPKSYTGLKTQFKKICREYFYFKRFVVNHRRTATYSMSQPVNKHSKHTNAAHICTVVISNLFLLSLLTYSCSRVGWKNVYVCAETRHGGRSCYDWPVPVPTYILLVFLNRIFHLHWNSIHLHKDTYIFMETSACRDKKVI